MRNSKAVFDYWHNAATYLKLMQLDPNSFSSEAVEIPRDQCVSGKLENDTLTNNLLQHGAEMLLAPLHLLKQQEHFIPFMLRATLKANGEILPTPFHALPVIPRNLLEPEFLQTISLGTPEDFDNYFNLQPPCWEDEPQLLTWENQYQYGNELLNSITSGKWLQELLQDGYELQKNALILPLAKFETHSSMDLKILQSKSKVELIAADRNANKSSYAQHKIAECWVEAAVKQAPAPGTVWLQGDQEARFTSIFACSKQTSIFPANTDLHVIQKQTHRDLSTAFNLYIKGKQVLRNWQEMTGKLNEKYHDKGGIDNRIKQLQGMLKEAHAKYRHIQVLHSIYVRQAELIPGWTKIFDIVKYFQTNRLQRLYGFFKQNFPNDKVDNLNQAELDNLMLEKINRVRNSERFIADALHQAISDQKQQELISEKLLSWGEAQEPVLTSTTQIEDYVQVQLWQQVVDLTARYWQLQFAITGNRNDFFNNEPQQIDLLIVEHAEYINPILAAQLLAKSQRAIIMGSYTAICNPRIPVAIDYELCRQARLVDCDADYEDLQFEGICVALGNMWNLVANGKEADRTFSGCLSNIEIEFCNIVAPNVDYKGSKINSAEIDGLHSWLLRNNYEAKDIGIYTTFAGQAHAIRQRLQNSKYAAVQVYLVNSVNIVKNKINIFSTVYQINDPGPYVFDRGVEILENLRANTQQKLIILGDRRLFKPELHSASGKFARSLGIQTEKDKIEEVV